MGEKIKKSLSEGLSKTEKITILIDLFDGYIAIFLIILFVLQLYPAGWLANKLIFHTDLNIILYLFLGLLCESVIFVLGCVIFCLLKFIWDISRTIFYKTKDLVSFYKKICKNPITKDNLERLEFSNYEDTETHVLQTILTLRQNTMNALMK